MGDGWLFVEHSEWIGELEEDDWKKLNGDQWADIIDDRPAFQFKGPTELTESDQGRFFARHPQSLERLYSRFLESKKPSFWAGFLTGQPQFADKCPWEKMKESDWDALLAKQPQLAGYRW